MNTFTNDELASLLIEVADRLRRGPPSTPGVPDGMVAVMPWGPRGNGKVRVYPKPVAFNPDDNTGDFSCAGYWDRISKMRDVDGVPFFPPERLGGWATPVHQPYMPPLSESPVTWPAWTDYYLHPADWYDQAELDREQAQLDRDVQQGNSWSPR